MSELGEKMAFWFYNMPVDGWVEEDDKGNLHIELFASAITQRGFKAGQYVKVRIVTKEDLIDA